jgi:hypothetical protein
MRRRLCGKPWAILKPALAVYLYQSKNERPEIAAAIDHSPFL